MNNMQWAGHVACMGEKCMQDFWWECLKVRNNLEDPNAKESVV